MRRYYDSGESTSLLEIISSPAVAAELKKQINSLSLQLSEAAREREAELKRDVKWAGERRALHKRLKRHRYTSPPSDSLLIFPVTSRDFFGLRWRRGRGPDITCGTPTHR